MTAVLPVDLFLRVIRKAKELRRETRNREEDRLEEMVGPPGVWKETRDFQVDFLRHLGLRPQHKLLDIGCGPLRGGIPLIQYLDRGNYTGMDIRPSVIVEAHRQIVKAKLADKMPRVLISHSFGRDEIGTELFDYVWCFQVLYHLEDELVESCLQQVSRFLGPQAVCFANVNAVGEQGRWKEFPYLRRPLEFYQALAAKYSIDSKNLGQQREFGYTQKVPGQFNHILEFRKKAPGPHAQST